MLREGGELLRHFGVSMRISTAVCPPQAPAISRNPSLPR
jgi:hypothetical protein